MRASELGGQFAHRIHDLVAITAGNEDGLTKEIILLRGICDDLRFLDQVPQQYPRKGAAIRPLTGEKEILDGREGLLTERREIKVLGKLHAASKAKEGGIPALTSDRRRLIFRGMGAFLRMDGLARHNNQTTQCNNKEPDIYHQTFLLCGRAGTRLLGDMVPPERCFCHVIMTKSIVYDNPSALHRARHLPWLTRPLPTCSAPRSPVPLPSFVMCLHPGSITCPQPDEGGLSPHMLTHTHFDSKWVKIPLPWTGTMSIINN